jgi:hypothetical protein
MSEMSPTPSRELDEAYYPELDELPPRPRRKLLTPVTVLLLVVLFAAGGFIGGVLVQKGQGSSTSALAGAGTGGFASRFGASGASGTSGTGAGFRSLFGGGAAGGGATIGTVSSIDGKTLYVTEAGGNTVAVVTTPESKITKNESVGSSAIHPGDSVVVEGITGSKGAITASSVNDSGSSSSATGGGFASLFGGGSSASSAASGATSVSGLFGR